jgi:hypothetical protein
MQGRPVYFTLGNITKDICHKVTFSATVLIGYLPILKASRLFILSDTQVKANTRLLPFGMGEIVTPLKCAGLKDVLMGCVDGYARHCFPVLAAYVADNSEQCMIACGKNNRSHWCTVTQHQHGDAVTAPARNPMRTANNIALRLRKITTDTFHTHSLNTVNKSFSANLLHTNIFTYLTPNLLHQFHCGVFKDHLLSLVRHCVLVLQEEPLPQAPGLQSC